MKPNAKDNVDEDGNPGKRHNLTISTFLMYFRLEMLAMILIQKCKTCFGCPRMVLCRGERIIRYSNIIRIVEAQY